MSLYKCVGVIDTCIYPTSPEPVENTEEKESFPRINVPMYVFLSAHCTKVSTWKKKLFAKWKNTWFPGRDVPPEH